MANAFEVLEGTVYYAQVLPSNYDRGNKEYDIQPAYKLTLIPDEESLEIVKKYNVNMKEASDNIPGVNVTLKNKFIENPLRIVDAADQDWDNSVLIGNGSRVRVGATMYPYRGGAKHSAFIAAGADDPHIRVLEHVEYEKPAE